MTYLRELLFLTGALFSALMGLQALYPPRHMKRLTPRERTIQTLAVAAALAGAVTPATHLVLNAARP